MVCLPLPRGYTSSQSQTLCGALLGTGNLYKWSRSHDQDGRHVVVVVVVVVFCRSRQSMVKARTGIFTNLDV